MKKAYLWALGLVLVGAGFLLDPFAIGLVESIRSPGLNPAMQGFVYLGSEVAVLLLVTFFLIYKKDKKKFILPWWITFFVSMAFVYALKFLIARERPDTITTLIVENNFSFPSGHTTAAFSSLPIIYRAFSENKKFWLTYVVLIGISRIYLGVHYLSDVVGGALLGLLIGVIVLKFYKKY